MPHIPCFCNVAQCGGAMVTSKMFDQHKWHDLSKHVRDTFTSATAACKNHILHRFLYPLIIPSQPIHQQGPQPTLDFQANPQNRNGLKNPSTNYAISVMNGTMCRYLFLWSVIFFFTLYIFGYITDIDGLWLVDTNLWLVSYDSCYDSSLGLCACIWSVPF